MVSIKPNSTKYMSRFRTDVTLDWHLQMVVGNTL